METILREQKFVFTFIIIKFKDIKWNPRLNIREASFKGSRTWGFWKQVKLSVIIIEMEHGLMFCITWPQAQIYEDYRKEPRRESWRTPQLGHRKVELSQGRRKLWLWVKILTSLEQIQCCLCATKHSKTRQEMVKNSITSYWEINREDITLLEYLLGHVSK